MFASTSNCDTPSRKYKTDVNLSSCNEVINLNFDVELRLYKYLEINKTNQPSQYPELKPKEVYYIYTILINKM